MSETCAGPSVLVPAGCPETPGCTGLQAPFVSKVHAQGWKPAQGRVLYLQGTRKRLDPVSLQAVPLRPTCIQLSKLIFTLNPEPLNPKL